MPQIIRDALSKRGCWIEIPTDNPYNKSNFLWKPTGFSHQVSAKV
jgi:hypothetical protein